MKYRISNAPQSACRQAMPTIEEPDGSDVRKRLDANKISDKQNAVGRESSVCVLEVGSSAIPAVANMNTIPSRAAFSYSAVYVPAAVLEARIIHAPNSETDHVRFDTACVLRKVEITMRLPQIVSPLFLQVLGKSTMGFVGEPSPISAA